VKPYFDRDGITIYHGDCLEIAPGIEGVDTVVTDPPYGVGFREEAWDETIPDWLPMARKVAPLVVFTTAPTTLWSYPRPDWVLCGARPGSTSRTSWGGFNHWTPVLVYGKGAWSTDIHSQPDILRVTENDGIGHPCPKSISLLRWLLRGAAKPGQLVLDPFMGSGTTLVAARDMGMRAIGIELEERYCEAAVNRLRQGVLFP
jgi:site-specific DNA-methyltransferase (adenine-specific)